MARRHTLKCLAAALTAAVFPVLPLAQGAPPRSSADILAVLEEHKPDPARVERFKTIVARPAPQTQDRIDLRNFHLQRARAAGALGMPEAQLESLAQAYALTPASDNNRGYYLLELAISESASGDYVSAQNRFETLVKEARSDGFLFAGLAAASSARSDIGNMEGSRQALKQAEAILARLRNSAGANLWAPVWQGIHLRARAVLNYREARYADAETDIRAAIAHWERGIQLIPQQRQYDDVTVEGRTQSLLRFYVTLIATLLEQGKLAEAELVARDALKRSLGVFGRYSPETGAVLMQVSRCIFEQGRFADAVTLARAAEDIFVRIGVAPYSVQLANTRRVSSAALVEQGRYEEAQQVIDALTDGLKQAPSGTHLLALESPAAIETSVRSGRFAEAVAMAQRLFDRVRKYGEVYGAHEARAYLAFALAADGQADRALQEFRHAIPELLKANEQQEQKSGLARARRATRMLEAYLDVLGGYALRGQAPEGLDPAAEAFRVSDIARGSAVQRALGAASARAAISDPELAKLAREEQDAAQRIASLMEIVVDLLSRPADKRPQGVIEAMQRDVEQLRKRRQEIRAQIEKRFPDYAELTNPKAVALDAARARLAPGEALIALYGTETRTYVWAVSPGATPRFHAAPLGRKERDALVAKLRAALDVGDVGIEQFPKFDVAAANALYAATLGAVEPAWADAKSLLVVPHGSLSQVPFALLATKPAPPADAAVPFAGYKQVEWLLRRAAVTQLPSVSTLVSLRSAKRARAPDQPFAGFGDPVFSKQQVAQAPAAQRGLRVRNLSIAQIAAPTPEKTTAAAVANSSGLAQLAPLPDTAQEIREIAAALKAAPGDVFLGRDANEKNVKSAALFNKRIVAFATHGLIPGDLDGLSEPALALTSPEVTGNKDEDGLLRMSEVLGLRLNADWVVLSACNTASPDGAGAEAVSGLGRAFFYAGARALLVSNWPVETVSARLLTTDVFRRQAEKPDLARAEALRQAMLQLVDHGTANDGSGKPVFSYAHPMFWAPFSLVGDGGN